MDKLYAIKIRQSDGTYGDEIPINVLAQNVDWDSSHTLVDILGVVDTTSPIQSQINNLVNTKASQADVNLLETRVDNIIANAGDDNTEIVDARVGADGTTYTVLKNRLDAEHTDVKSAFYLYDAMEGYLLSVFPGNFAIGGLDNNGALLPSQKYRVSSSSPITLDYDVHIKPLAGFRFGWCTIVNGSATWSGWKTEETTIPSGTNFALQLARVSEVTSEIANVPEFTSSYIIRGKLLGLVESTRTFVKRELEQDFATFGADYPVVVGTWQDGAFVYWARRLTCEAPISVGKGDTVKFLSPTLKINLFMSNGQNSGWISPSSEEKEFICSSDGLLYILLGKTDDAIITASEYSATVKIYNTTRSEINKLVDKEDYLVRASDTIGLRDIELSWEQGNIEDNGNLVQNAKRIRTTTAYDMPRLLDVEIANGFMFTVKQFAGTTVVNDSGWITESRIVERHTTATTFKLTFAFSNNADITPSYCSNITASPKYENIGENVEDLVDDVFGTYANTYYGEAFPSKVNGFNSAKLMTISYSSSIYTLNDIATYGDYILFFLNPGTIYVYQLSTKTKVGEIVVGTQHFACAMFSDTFYDSGDPFPLLYADTTHDGIYNVIRFTSLTSATIIKNYKFDTALYGTSPQVSFDFMNNRAYCVGDDVTTPNKYKLFTFDMTSELENQDGTFSFAEISSGTFPFYQTRQGNTFFNNRVFMAFANTVEPFNPKIVSFDCSTGNAIITSLFNTLPFTGEAEGLTVAQIDGKNCILVTDYYNVYQLNF